MHGCFVYMYECVLYAHMVSTDGYKEDIRILGTGILWATTRVLEIEPGSSESAANILNHWATSPTSLIPHF